MYEKPHQFQQVHKCQSCCFSIFQALQRHLCGGSLARCLRTPSTVTQRLQRDLRLQSKQECKFDGKILTSSILRSITRNSIISKHSIAISSLSEHITSKHLHQVSLYCLLTLRLVPLPGLVSPCLHQIMIRELG